ncbi:hypothetical protein GUJ93_ZPchr0004g38424 [Zizania palustris]|uniref:Uncharacterized protein n=1 Tax=Zizania palustris TaxID=103762 RepID=A0A8J5SHW0_ZIZPA|nr:hypothetical protein GUJ93_ZPchr0181g29101 [Zizania palustris]KAG8064072.1 hypothetical protein GUJ93_ZPchr0004g38424 [Zizania palustris]
MVIFIGSLEVLAASIDNMEKRCSILLLLSLVVLLSYAIVEVSANRNNAVFSRKDLIKDGRKLAVVTGMASSLQHADTASGGTTAASAYYTPMTMSVATTTTDSHHDMSAEQYRNIIHNNQQLSKP